MMNNPTIRLPMLMRFPSPRLDLGRGIGGAGDCREFKQRRPADRPQDAVAAPLDPFAALIDTEARRQAPDQPARVSRQKVARPCRAIRNRRLDHQRVVAIGCDEGAARLVGIRVDRTKIQAYALLGLFAGIAAILYVARLRNVEVNIGTNIALEAIAATILGGANIRGGIGSLIGALMGVLFIKMTQNGLVLIGVSSLWETVVIGGLLVVVLILDALETRRVA